MAHNHGDRTTMTANNIESDIPPYTEETSPEAKAAREQWHKDLTKQKEYEKAVNFVEQELGPIDWRYHIDEDHPFNASELRDQLLTKQDFNIITDRKTQVIYLWTAKTGVYHKDGEQYLRTLIDRILGKESTTRRINETIELLKVRTYATVNPSQKIAVLNGLLDIQTGHVGPFVFYEFNTNKLNVIYKADAKCPKWEKFIDQVCPDDKLLLQEWSGYLLIKGMPYHAIMWFYGPKGRNGKGTWARTIQAILGEDNYSAVQLKDLDGSNRFAVFNLQDSLLNICSEPRADKILTVEQLLALSGEDTLDAERKGVQARFKLKNGAKITIMGNKFPNILNPTDAFWERLKLIKWPFRFVGDAQIPNIENTWLNDPEERSGILNWMIEGALRLIKNKGKFTQTKSQEQVIIQFKRASDNISSYIMECLALDIKAITPKVDCYSHYKEYCDAIGVQVKSQTEFNEKLEGTIGIKSTSTRLGIGKDKKKVKIWKGFTLKPLPDVEDTDTENEEEENNETEQTTLNSNSGTSGTSGTSFKALSSENSNEVKNNKDNTQKAVPAVPAVPSVLNPEVVKDRFCGSDCGNFDKAACPRFTQKIPKDFPILHRKKQR